MNVVLYSSFLAIGTVSLVVSGVWNRKFFWIGTAILLFFWAGIWGQIAVRDGWWVYRENFISFGHLGFPIIDLFYFFGGVGWYTYLCRKLDLFS